MSWLCKYVMVMYFCYGSVITSQQWNCIMLHYHDYITLRTNTTGICQIDMNCSKKLIGICKTKYDFQAKNT